MVAVEHQQRIVGLGLVPEQILGRQPGFELVEVALAVVGLTQPIQRGGGYARRESFADGPGRGVGPERGLRK